MQKQTTEDRRRLVLTQCYLVYWKRRGWTWDAESEERFIQDHWSDNLTDLRAKIDKGEII